MCYHQPYTGPEAGADAGCQKQSQHHVPVDPAVSAARLQLGVVNEPGAQELHVLQTRGRSSPRLADSLAQGCLASAGQGEELRFVAHNYPHLVESIRANALPSLQGRLFPKNNTTPSPGSCFRTTNAPKNSQTGTGKYAAFKTQLRHCDFKVPVKVPVRLIFRQKKIYLSLSVRQSSDLFQ